MGKKWEGKERKKEEEQQQKRMDRKGSQAAKVNF